MATVSKRQSRDGKGYNKLENVAMTLPQIPAAITQVRAQYYQILFFKKKLCEKERRANSENSIYSAGHTLAIEN